MMDYLLRFGLGLAGVPESTTNDIDQQLPAMLRLSKLAKQAEPILTRNKPHIDAILPHLIAMKSDGLALAALMQQAWPDIVAVTPTVQELIDFANGK